MAEIEDSLVEDPEGEQVFSVVFGIGEPELRTYRTIAEVPGCTARELTDILNRDRSNVNRALATLTDKGLVNAQQKLLPEGGVTYQYFVSVEKETVRRLRNGLDVWNTQAKDQLESLVKSRDGFGTDR